MRLPGRTNAQIRIRVPRIIVVHVQTILVEFTDIHKVAIGRPLILPLSLCSPGIY